MVLTLSELATRLSRVVSSVVKNRKVHACSTRYKHCFPCCTDKMSPMAYQVRYAPSQADPRPSMCGPSGSSALTAVSGMVQHSAGRVRAHMSRDALRVARCMSSALKRLARSTSYDSAEDGLPSSGSCTSRCASCVLGAAMLCKALRPRVASAVAASMGDRGVRGRLCEREPENRPTSKETAPVCPWSFEDDSTVERGDSTGDSTVKQVLSNNSADMLRKWTTASPRATAQMARGTVWGSAGRALVRMEAWQLQAAP